MSLFLRGSFGARAARENNDGEKWSVIFPRGTWYGANLAPIGGSITLTDSLFAEMIANWKAEGAPALPVYFHHPPPIEEVPVEKRKEVFAAAGHMEDFRITERGLEARTAWSAEGQKALDEDKYRFVSPEWQPRHVSRRDGQKRGWLVTAAALTDTPFFNEMPRVAASTGEAERGVDAARKWLKAAIVLHEKHMSGRAPTTGPEGEKSQQQMMDQMMSALAALDSMPRVAAAALTTEKHMDKKRICAALGLKDDCGDEEVMAALEAKCKATAPVDAEKLTAAVKLTGDLESKLKAANEEVITLKAAAEAHQNERFAEQVAVLVADGKREGRPLDTLAATATFKAAKSLDDVKALIASVPVSVPLKAKGEPGSTEGLTRDTARVQYDTAVAAKVKAGSTYVEAARLTARELPDVSALLFGNSTSST